MSLSLLLSIINIFSPSLDYNIDAIRSLNVDGFISIKQETNPEFISFIKKFEDEFNVKVENIPIYFHDFEPSKVESLNGNLTYSATAGTCTYIASNHIFTFIRINPIIWRHSSETQKEIIIYHELGHCMFYLEHNNNNLYDSRYGLMPESIMNENSPVEDGEINYYKDHRSEYIEQFKQEIKYGKKLIHINKGEKNE
jgi:predicted SprT family Zn-dependent metalloprotease